MVTWKHYIFLSILLLLVGCSKNEFTLDFKLSSELTDNYNVTYYATDIKGGATVQAVASVREGKCVLNGVTKKPTLVFLTQRRGVVPLVVYAERGKKIEITGSGKNPLEWRVEGNEINEELSRWINENSSILIENNADSVNKAVKEYVELNESNPVAAIMMLCYYHRYADERGYATLMHALEGEAHNPDWLTLAARSDQLYHHYYFPSAIESIVMRSPSKENEKNNKDTLIINHRDPVLLFFWQTGDNDKKNIIDSIKVLNKEFADSVLLLADICLDVDSTAWRNSIRRDTIENVKRFWTPLGLADPLIQKFKVDEIPYYIVFEKNGHQYYRGAELDKAMKDYRELSGLRDSI